MHTRKFLLTTIHIESKKSIKIHNIFYFSSERNPIGNLKRAMREPIDKLNSDLGPMTTTIKKKKKKKNQP